VEGFGGVKVLVDGCGEVLKGDLQGAVEKSF
jgi:hypothetical protein